MADVIFDVVVLLGLSLSFFVSYKTASMTIVVTKGLQEQLSIVRRILQIQDAEIKGLSKGDQDDGK